jgi:broad specificity phosphatase PhoE
VSGSYDVPTRLLILRHGESEWNAAGRWQGTEDPSLSERGIRQAVAAAEVLGTFDAVWASTLQRASLTADIIAEHLGIGPVTLDARLVEVGYGPWQGLTRDEIEAGWPGYLEQARRPEGAEPFDAVVDRVTAAVGEIARATPGGEVLVVAHGGILRLLRRSLGAGGHDDHFANLGGARFTVHGNGRITAEDTVSVIDSATSLDVL